VKNITLLGRPCKTWHQTLRDDLPSDGKVSIFWSYQWWMIDLNLQIAKSITKVLQWTRKHISNLKYTKIHFRYIYCTLYCNFMCNL